MSEKPKEGKRLHRVEDIEELRKVLKTVREQVPGLLKDISAPVKELMTITLYEKQTKERAKAIAAFYKELVAAGMNEETAIKMTEQQFVNPVAFVLGKLGETPKIRN
ncbi:MAG: hypothetical protein HYU02_03865 [Thaumarchaeota archaeon]|nr:hypothetical protein [Nitrososphaerota archaeon]